MSTSRRRLGILPTRTQTAGLNGELVLDTGRVAKKTRQAAEGTGRAYIHRWRIKDQCSPKTPVIARDAQILANTWGQTLRRSTDEPEADPVFSPTEIRFSVPEDGREDFRYPPDPSGNEKAVQPAGHASCNTDMMPYDQLITAIVLAIKHHLGDDAVVTSDGNYPGPTWNAAVILYLRTFPERDVPNLDNWPAAWGHVK